MKRGEILDNTYQIVEEIGDGGGGVVYKAIHIRLKKYVAVKMVKENVAGLINTRGEADILKNLKHNYLPQVYDFLQIDHKVYTVMDFIPGHSLDEYLKKGVRFKQKQIIIWAKQLCEALSYLHHQTPPIIHSDVKPANIMITPQGNICLIDFNISFGTDGPIGGMSSGYASPEQFLSMTHTYMPTDAKGRYIVDTRSDIYSLGATLYHVVTGRKPAKNPRDIVPLGDYDLDYSDTLLAIINKAMQPNVKYRYQTIDEMLKDLSSIQKLDPQYKKQCLMEKVSTYLCLGGILICLAVSFAGFRLMGSEREAAYRDKVEAGRQYVTAGEYDTACQLFDEAIALDGTDVAAYYEKLYALSMAGDPKQVLALAEKLTSDRELDEQLKEDTALLANVYYMAGDACFEQEDYEAAVDYYQKSLDSQNDNLDCYRDMAIALARQGDLEGAQSALTQARDSGLASADTALVEGELAVKRKDYTTAIRKFKETVDTADDDYVKERAYFLCAQSYRDAGNVDDMISWLEAGKNTYGLSQTNTFYTMLGDAYALKGQQAPEQAASYYEKAESCYKQLTDSGLASVQVWYNLVTVQQSLGKYDEAKSVLEKLMADYPQDYRAPMRMAFICCEIENAKEASRRDYREVAEYYEKAWTLYEENMVDGKTDVQMQQLENIMQQLYDGKWLVKEE